MLRLLCIRTPTLRLALLEIAAITNNLVYQTKANRIDCCKKYYDITFEKQIYINLVMLNGTQHCLRIRTKLN